MARFFADENFPLPVVEALRLAGHDVLTIHEMGDAGRSIPDAAVLSHATSDQRAVLTLNRKDFFRLHRQDARHAGIVACTYDPDFPRQAARIDEAVRAAGPLMGLVVRVNRPDR